MSCVGRYTLLIFQLESPVPTYHFHLDITYLHIHTLCRTLCYSRHPNLRLSLSTHRPPLYSIANIQGVTEKKRQSKMKRLAAFRDRVLETKDGVENVADVVENALVSVG